MLREDTGSASELNLTSYKGYSKIDLPHRENDKETFPDIETGRTAHGKSSVRQQIILRGRRTVAEKRDGRAAAAKGQERAAAERKKSGGAAAGRKGGSGAAPEQRHSGAGEPADLAGRRALAEQVIARLKEQYPGAKCTLDYRDAWQLLVSVRLAAQCTDKRVDEVTPRLYAKFPTVAALAAAPVEEIEEIVRPCGLGPSKARDISRCMKVLHEKYNDMVPDDFDELLSLPGVGRKSANLVMGDVFGKPAIVTDTHCIRLSNLIGFVDDVREPAKVEKLLWQIIPPEEGNDLCHRLVQHGREVCIARRPQCGKCCLADLCRFGKQAVKRDAETKRRAAGKAAAAPDSAAQKNGASGAVTESGDVRT